MICHEQEEIDGKLGKYDQSAQTEKAQINKKGEAHLPQEPRPKTHVEAILAHEATDHAKAVTGRH